jgi:putative endonuclease
VATHNLTGQIGEQLAADYLQKNGYLIIERNLRVYGIEVDIIAQKQYILVFVEVKTRTNNLLPIDRLFPKQQRERIIRAANFYVQKNSLDVDVRFDVIFIQKQRDQYTIEHIENAFYPQW